MQIHHETGLQYQFIVYWVDRFSHGGTVEDLARSGRPKKLTTAVKQRIKRMMKDKKNKSVRFVSGRLKAQGLDVSRESVRRAAKGSRLRPKRPVESLWSRRATSTSDASLCTVIRARIGRGSGSAMRRCSSASHRQMLAERVGRAEPTNLDQLKRAIVSAWDEVMTDEYRLSLV
jgi:transposase